MTDEFDRENFDDDDTATLRRLLRNAERASRGPATPQHDALDRQFEAYQSVTKGLSEADESGARYETGAEHPEIESWEPRRVRPGERGALVGNHFFGVRGLVIGGKEVRDLVVVSSRRLEFTVPEDASSTDVVLLYEAFDYASREQEMELTDPDITPPK